MSKRHLPSVRALLDADDRLLIAELKVCEVREHVAVARSLLDALDRLVPMSAEGQPSPSEQVGLAAEELARLGCKIVELASTLAGGTAEAAPVGVAAQAS